MSKIRVYMGIPSMGDRWDYQGYALRDIEKRYADEIELVYPEQCVHRFGHDFARNEIVEEFLESDCDILWFLDSDIGPAPHVLDLITLHGDKWLAAGAPYPLWLMTPHTKEMGVAFTAYKGNAPTPDGKAMGLSMAVVPKSGTEWVDGLATGCLFLKRELFKQLEKPYFQFKRKPENQECTEGEDLGFALKLQKLGIKYFCDHSMVCGHRKTVDLLQVGNYAISFANNKLEEYDRQIRAQVLEACKAEYARGYRDAMAAKAAVSPQKTKSGLILPGSLAT